jgi:hypothetical protein
MKDDSPFLKSKLIMNIYIDTPSAIMEGIPEVYDPVFKRHGYEFNGFLLARFIFQILGEKAPDLLKNLAFNPYYGQTNIVFMESWEDLRRFQEIIVPIFQNALLLESYIKKTNQIPQIVKGARVQFYSHSIQSDEFGEIGKAALEYLQEFAHYTLAEIWAGPRYGKVILEEFPGRSLPAYLFSYIPDLGIENHVV